MQGRSWMAALTLTGNALLGLILGLGLPVASRADDPKTTPTPAPAPAATETAPSKVVLDVRIAGLGPGGCDVEVAPGSSDCQFRPISLHITPQDYSFGKKIPLNDVRATSTDRYCIFSITIREPGQPVTTVRRGLRLVALSSDRQESAQLLNCFLSSPSRLAKTSEMRERR
jgi:hypothetical protein